ncbi:MAG: MFS transporter [Dethiobacteria bacterium]|jgi:GPH family glycoside/pentoside/hexuronide:cation symporter
MAKRLPFWGKIAYGAGSAGWVLLDRVVMTWLYYFYITSPIEGVSRYVGAALFGAVMFGGRFIDAIADPIIAKFSDNFNSRLGRRIPFMLASGIFYVLVFIALFYPPVQGESPWNALHLFIFLGLFFTFFTGYVCPYLALLAELAHTQSDRVDLTTYRSIFYMVGGALGMLVSGILIDALGFHGMVWVLAAVALPFLYVPALIKEKDYTDAQPATMGLIEAVKSTLQNRPFTIYLVGIITLQLGYNIFTINLPLYATQLLGKSEGEASLFFLAQATAVIAFPLLNYLSKKLGLKKGMIFTMLLFVAALPFTLFVSNSLTVISPTVLLLAILGVMGIAQVGVMIVPDAIVACVSDLEERRTGQRREAMYFGTQGLLVKMAMGASALVSGTLIQLFGDTLGVQLSGPAAAIIILIGMIFFAARYPEKEVLAASREVAAGGPSGGASS